ncbi:MAG: alpha-hydroxy-acid oxidizing protein [Acidobacteria bacterium]|nr:alpha-hydroxy-acid oxidizing protein [Acidobacteriota bacterium]
MRERLVEHNRRRFLRYLAASPLSAGAFGQDAEITLASPADALNVMDFEAVAKKKLPPAHLGFMMTGTDDDETLRANREGYQRFQLLPRRLVDFSQVSLKTELFGLPFETPIFLCPVASHRMYDPEGELAVARAAKARQTEILLSTNTSTAIEDVVRERGKPVMFQLYAAPRWDMTEKMVKRVEDAGTPIMAWTVDTLGGRNTETYTRYRRMDKRPCEACHGKEGPARMERRVMYKGIDLSKMATPDPPHTWTTIERLKKLSKMKLLIKGITTPEDALLAREHGADGVIISNHGGRAEASGRGTIEALKDIVDAVGPGFPVLIDGGVRRGTDVFKALALGARAVGIGRPYLWGLASFGQAGVDRVLELLNAELRLAMRQFGTPEIGRITRKAVTWR